PRIARFAFVESGERSNEAVARLLHAAAKCWCERAVAIDAFVGLRELAGRIPVGAHRPAAAVMNQARRMLVTVTAKEAGVPVTMRVAQTNAVHFGVAARRGRVPSRAPGCEEFDNGGVSCLDRRGARPGRCDV